MAESPTIDYKIAFEEVSLLNKLFAEHTDYALPALNPDHFVEIETEAPFGDIIIHGIRSGATYRSKRISYKDDNGYIATRYTPFFHVVPKERTVIEWASA